MEIHRCMRGPSHRNDHHSGQKKQRRLCRTLSARPVSEARCQTRVMNNHQHEKICCGKVYIVQTVYKFQYLFAYNCFVSCVFLQSYYELVLFKQTFCLCNALKHWYNFLSSWLKMLFEKIIKHENAINSMILVFQLQLQTYSF